MTISEEFWQETRMKIAQARGIFADAVTCVNLTQKKYTRKRLAEDVKRALDILDSIGDPHELEQDEEGIR